MNWYYLELEIKYYKSVTNPSGLVGDCLTLRATFREFEYR